MAWAGVNVEIDRLISVPHSNHAFVACAFGFTVPLRIAVCTVIPVAAAVVAMGGGGWVSPLSPPPHADRRKAVNRIRTRKPADR
jgi:hypothetical protein